MCLSPTNYLSRNVQNFTLQAMLFEPIGECSAAHIQEMRRACLITPELLQRLEDELFLDRLHIQARVGQMRWKELSAGAPLLEEFRKHVEGDVGISGQ